MSKFTLYFRNVLHKLRKYFLLVNKVCNTIFYFSMNFKVDTPCNALAAAADF